GALTSGINYLADVTSPQPTARRSPGIQYQGGAAGMFRPRDPKRGCVPSDPSIGSLRYGRDYGYQYNVPVSGEESQNRKGFSLCDFGKEMLTGAVTGGMAGAAFYGAGRAVSALKESIKGGSSPQAISNKFPNDNQKGKTFDYTIENGNVKIRDGIQEADFIIDMDGNLHIGRGHSYLANGNSVQAAGKMKVNSQGYIRNIINDSGHYQPTVSEALNYPNVLRSAGLNVDNAWIRVDSFTSSLSNYVIDSKVFYNGPVKYLPH
ncbi:MAG: hypothetical protein OSJ60_19835, partial [Lachnospiraceae bacterium]|nr:hypothetical protein [Lachnospiraceae bacterium]